MFKFWLTGSATRVGTFYAPETGVGGGSGADPTGSGAGSPPADDSSDGVPDLDTGAETVETVDARPAPGGDDEEALDALLQESDELEEQLNASPSAEVIKKIRGQHRKLLRRISKMEPVYRSARGADIEDLRRRAGQYDRAAELLATDKQEFARHFGLDVTAPVRAAEAPKGKGPKSDTSGLIDLDSLPFDREGSDVNKFAYTLAERVNAVLERNQAIEAELREGRERIESETLQDHTQRWTNAIDDAVKAVPKEQAAQGRAFAAMCKLAMGREAEKAKLQRRGQLPKGQKVYSPQFVINHYKMEFGLTTPATAPRVDAAAAQRTAEKVKALSTAQTNGNGIPAKPREGEKLRGLQAAHARMRAAL